MNDELNESLRVAEVVETLKGQVDYLISEQKRVANQLREIADFIDPPKPED